VAAGRVESRNRVQKLAIDFGVGTQDQYAE
jgi:hypothetical protein